MKQINQIDVLDNGNPTEAGIDLMRMVHEGMGLGKTIIKRRKWKRQLLEPQCYTQDIRGGTF